MNKVILMGRLARDPDVRYTQGAEPLAVARYTVAVDRRFSRKDAEAQQADFISCVSFGKQGEFAERYLKKGVKIALVGRLQTGSYTNKDGQKVYTTDVVVEEVNFAESKAASQSAQMADEPRMSRPSADINEDEFMSMDQVMEEELPF